MELTWLYEVRKVATTGRGKAGIVLGLVAVVVCAQLVLTLLAGDDLDECGDDCIEWFENEFEHSDLSGEEFDPAIECGQPATDEDRSGEGSDGRDYIAANVNGQPQDLYRRDVVRNMTWTEALAGEQRKVLERRRTVLLEKCKTLDLFMPSKADLYNTLHWATKFDLVWCPVFKAASTTWSRNLVRLAGEEPRDATLKSRLRKLYPPPGTSFRRENFLKGARKLLIVRHPLERLLSVYRDKMLLIRSRSKAWQQLQKAIMSNYPEAKAHAQPPSSPHSLAESEERIHPSFTQFLLKVKHDLESFQESDGEVVVSAYWLPYWYRCAPCYVYYDLIAHMETLQNDHTYVVNDLGFQDHFVNARTHASCFDSYNGTSEAVKDYFRQVPRSLLKDIVRLYRPDFELFGYSPDAYLALAQPDDL